MNKDNTKFTILAVPKLWNIQQSQNGKWEKVFKGHKGLKKIQMESGVEGVAANVFYGCGKLERVQFAGTEKELGEGSFKFCPKLRALRKLPSNFIEKNSDGSLKLSEKIEKAFDEKVNKAILTKAESALKWPGNRFVPAVVV